jgi:HD-GYP domain-containing protein (c-di-GMP phosphodiesterase class II)
MTTENPEHGTTHFTRALVDFGATHAVVANQAIFNAQGIKILDKGARIHEGLYERLTSHKLNRPIEESVSAEGLVDGQALVDGIEMLIGFGPLYGRLVTQPAERQKIFDIIEKLPLPEPVAFQLTVARATRPRLFENALRSAWLMAWLAHTAGETQFDIGMAAAAGLLHDLGMMHLDPALLDPSTELTRELRRELYSHPIISNLLIERHHVYSKEVLEGVLQHHEYLNGSGYPRHLEGTQIGLMGKRLAICDLVVAMTNGTPGGSELRLGVLLRLNTHRYERTLIDQVLAVLQPDETPCADTIVQLEEPAQVLLDVYATLQAWPRDASRFEGVTAARKDGMLAVTALADQVARNLAEAGLTPAQLEQMGPAAQEDTLLQCELTLLAHEAAWQLHVLARQARRRWRAGREGSYPREIQEWADRVETLTRNVRSALLATDDDH